MVESIGRTKRGPQVAASLLLAMTLAACGGGGGGGGSPSAGGSPGTTPTPATPTPATPTPAPTPASYQVTGTISVTEPSVVDSDTNDPNQTGRRDNGSFATAQTLPNPAQVAGYVAMPGGNPQGAIGAAGDLHDGYKVSLAAGQVIELEFAADPAKYDLDLSVYTPDGQLVGSSFGVNQYECVRVTEAGSYVIGVETYRNRSSGGSIYQLRIGTPDPTSRCPNATAANAGMLAGRIMAVAKPAIDVRTRAVARGAVVQIDGGGSGGHDGLHLVQMPAGSVQRQTASQTLTGLAAQQKSARRVSDRSAAAAQEQDRVWRQGLTEEARELRETTDYAKLMVDSGAYVSATPDRLVYTQQTTGWPAYPSNDRDIARQRWHYDAISLPSAIAALRAVDLSASPAPIVAIVDSGIVAEHPDLASQLVAGYDMISNTAQAGDGDGPDADPNDASRSAGWSFHGTHVAGTVAAQAGNGIGGTGVAPMARIMPVRAVGASGAGSFYDILQGVRFAAGLPTDRGVRPVRRADVINLSLGGTSACVAEVAEVFRQVRAAGTLVVAAAGNDSTRSRGAPVSMPANCPGVLAVGAIDAQNQRAYYSNVGAEIAVAAPGGDSTVSTSGSGLPDAVYSTTAAVDGTQRVSTYGGLQGTSMAAPHMAGVLALMRWVNPGITADQIDALLRDGTIVDDLGSSGRDNTYGHGVINARKAVTAALATRSGAPAPSPVAQIQPRPASINMGSTRTEADLLLTLDGSTNERIVSVTAESSLIGVAPKTANSVVAATGLGTYRVTVNRTSLAAGASAIANVVVTLSPARTINIPVSVSRSAAGGSLGTLGPVYVLILDADDPAYASVAGVTVNAPTAGVYRYRVTVPGTKSIVVVAGTDLDNDNFICQSGEGCGGYPSLSSDMSVLTPTADVTGVDFAIWPIGGSQPRVSAATGDATQSPSPSLMRR